MHTLCEEFHYVYFIFHDESKDQEDIIKLLLKGETSITEQLVLEHNPIRRPYPISIVTGKIPNNFLIHSVWGYNKENKWAVLLTINQIDAFSLNHNLFLHRKQRF